MLIRLLSLLDGDHYEVISSLQDQDAFCHHILTQLRRATQLMGHPYTIDNDIFTVTVKPQWSMF